MPLSMRGYLRQQEERFAAGMRLTLDESIVREAAPQAARKWLDRFALMAYYLSLTKAQRARFASFTGLGDLERAREKGRPVIVATFHFGRYDAVGPSLGSLGLEVSMLVQREALEWARHDVARLGLPGDFDLESDPNLEFIPFPSLTAIPRAARALATGRVLLALPDFIGRGGGRRSMPFLGLPVYPSYAVEMLSNRTGAAVFLGDASEPLGRNEMGEPNQPIKLGEVSLGDDGVEWGWLTRQLLMQAGRRVLADPVGWNLWPLLAMSAEEATEE